MFKTLLVVLSLATLVGCSSNKVKPPTQEELATAKKVAEIETYKNSPTRSLYFLDGKVVKVAGTLPGLVRSTISVSGEGISGGGETVAIGNPTYILHVQTSEGLYVVQVVDGDFLRGHLGGTQTIWALSTIIKVGTEVIFPTGFHYCQYDYNDSWKDVNLFSPSRIGMVEANQIEVK
jgi:hypothetical protein